ncbi:MAG: asparagine synthase (glutamine-hydrolyzing), partial [Flavobacterium sp.]
AEGSAQILKMLLTQKHRGPDDSGIAAINRSERTLQEVSEFSNPVSFIPNADLVLGFNRLSILDLSIKGHQPMTNSDKSVVMMLNGEIYNAFSYKEQLEKKGYKFKSTTDTEVVLNLYLEYGIDTMLQMLNGMFAIVIYDFRNDTLFLARDRFGIKPLYIYEGPHTFAFASELKSFKGLPEIPFRIEESALDEYLLFRNVINKTLFKGIRNCTPGTYLSVSKSGTIKEHRFYDIDKEGEEYFEDSNAQDHLDRMLKESVERQMISDVKLGSQLSGGVDSSLVTYYAAKALDKGNLETISIIFDDPKFSEEKYVDYVAEKSNLLAHKYILSPEYYLDHLDKVTWHLEQPVNHPNTIGIYLLSQKAKQHVTVLLSGEGADESLAGYSRFVNTMMPYSLRKFLGVLKVNRKNIKEFVNFYSTIQGRTIMGSSFGNIASAKLLKGDFNLGNAIAQRKHLISGLKGDDLLIHRKYELLAYLPDLLMRQDKMSMAHCIENRVPFLDNEMVSTSLKIRPGLLVNNSSGKMETKVLLKDICAQKFNRDFAYRNKMGFGIPLKQFLNTKSFNERWNDQLLPGLVSRGVFNLQSFKDKDFSRLDDNEIGMLWNMTAFELWAQKYVD